MVNNCFNWITVALHNEFGSDYKFYVEEIEQNVKKPCFVVGTLNPLVKARSPVKYRRVVPIVLYYFTNKENTVDAKRDCYEIAERLFDSLEYLRADDDVIIRGSDISWEVVEGVLQFFVTYSFDVIKEKENIYMGDASYNGSHLS